MHVRLDFSPKDPEWDALEAQWMSELAAGGTAARSALARFFKTYGKLFERRLERMGLRDQAADTAQGLWIEIARAAPRYRGDVPVRVFLLGCLRTARLRHFADPKRKRERENVESIDDDAQDATELAEPETGGAKSGPEWFDFRRCVQRAFARFEQRHPAMASLLLFRHVEELSLDEMIAELGGSVDRAKAELFAARRKMEPLIKPCLELWPDRGRKSTP